ncbi:MAG: hypothetical protein A2W05_10760 [Candidatus Schekmanbacteria bacterium RBG_16_38_10]|uniref:4Fe-4S ferredoxin-type domain-containing protein n=1 Tax=Candidatus Schekmanbacteria bacterium RBG_16_38_10 TaxID=1817879 RepID=A0A1F7RV03_9BACT|nr:MAG: hypothetical protein A2W05_10760 [Candidatus Schekmanbacteria bacterium RBG_16_38_10]
MEKKNYNDLKEISLLEGMSLFGIADLNPIRHTFHPSLSGMTENLFFGISMGFHLSEAILDGIIDRPTLIYKHHYKAVNYKLDQTALKIVKFIQDNGYNALPIPSSQTIDWENQLGHLSHKLVAKMAGLGFIGRSTLLVNPQYGAKVRYITVLTDLPLKPNQLLEIDCRECKRCIEACPAQAITEKSYDMKKCLEKLKEFSKEKGIGVYICGICVKGCLGK